MTTRPTHAISVRQPWADLILFGDPHLEGTRHHRKDVENRTWQLPRKWFGVPMFLHAGKQNEWWAPSDPEYDPTRHGALLGVVTFEHVVQDAYRHYGEFLFDKLRPPSRWAVEGQYHWLISAAEPLPDPIPYRGRLGVFPIDLPEEVQL